MMVICYDISRVLVC